ncbi:uncharacterized protein LTHEOB_6351 [Lasiodiplodia theobromae]|uniref:uncharacterized protein n=1 Tax=Lasiodiplodia theobromae TaxID=45133 RepID=UPI0015C3EB7A|nr:uncharacterized protein LTHEOB_6351 [Lasiodiplodia theobromae]KAF4544233.1 hypothetical protein LTHEOB_6351 [Lasiodiplodia theobromae]
MEYYISAYNQHSNHVARSFPDLYKYFTLKTTHKHYYNSVIHFNTNHFQHILYEYSNYNLHEHFNHEHTDYEQFNHQHFNHTPDKYTDSTSIHNFDNYSSRAYNKHSNRISHFISITYQAALNCPYRHLSNPSTTHYLIYAFFAHPPYNTSYDNPNAHHLCHEHTSYYKYHKYTYSHKSTPGFDHKYSIHYKPTFTSPSDKRSTNNKPYNTFTYNHVPITILDTTLDTTLGTINAISATTATPFSSLQQFLFHRTTTSSSELALDTFTSKQFRKCDSRDE